MASSSRVFDWEKRYRCLIGEVIEGAGTGSRVRATGLVTTGLVNTYLDLVGSDHSLTSRNA
jgi:hypothetical protein